MEIRTQEFHQVGYEFKDSELVEESFDSCSAKGFGQIQENHAGHSTLVKVFIDSPNKTGQLQRRAASGSETQLLVTHTALVYFSEAPCE
jgi:hypothetical protein